MNVYNVKCTFEDGNFFYTSINAKSAEEVANYYMFHYFNLGTVGDCIKKCIKVEFLY